MPLFLFWGLLLVWLFPWSIFLPQALARVPLLRVREASQSRPARVRILLFLSAFIVVLFFSFSTRQEYYVLPAVPPLALLVGSWLGEEDSSPADSRMHRRGRISSAVLAILGVIALALTSFLAISSPTVPSSTDIADLLHAGPEESQQYALSLGHFLDLNTRVMSLFRAPLLIFGLSLFVGATLNWHFRRRSRPAWGNWALALMTIGLLVATDIALVTFSPILTSKPLADAIARVYKPGDIIVINGEYEGGSTLNYYTGYQVRIWNGRSANLWYGSLFPDAPQIFDDNESFRRLWNGPNRVFLWTETEKQPLALDTMDPNSVFVLGRYGGKLILTNQPLR